MGRSLDGIVGLVYSYASSLVGQRRLEVWRTLPV